MEVPSEVPHSLTGARWRHQTETRLRELFIQRGGSPDRDAPHYFVLGTSTWYRGLATDMRALTLRVDALPQAETSFTLLDSFSAMGFGPEYSFPATADPDEAVVYRIDELDAVLRDRPGCDDAAVTTYEGYELSLVNRYVEVQLWSDEPVVD